MSDPDTDFPFMQDFSRADDNVLQTFQLESSNLRGRVVRLGSVLDDILQAHNYPFHVSHMVAETVALSALLSSMLKYDGVFTLQAQGDGPVGMVVSDMTSAGILRGCSHFDAERLQHGIEQLSAMNDTESSQNHYAQLLGKGYLAFTVDQAGKQDRYQGIVELKGASLVDCVQHYFTQSEQIGTGIKIAVGMRGGKWRAGGVMLQHMPEDHTNPEAAISNVREDDWRRAMILMGSCTDNELLDPMLHSNILLTRLFHEEGIRVYEPKDVYKGCRCSEEKVENVIGMMSQDDLDYMTQDGQISMRCEFCSREYVFEANKIISKIMQKRHAKEETLQ